GVLTVAIVDHGVGFLANIALAALDEHIHGPWLAAGVMSSPRRRQRRREKSLPNWRIVRYAGDFVLLVAGERDDLQTLHDDIARVLEPLGLRLSGAKTRIVHMSEGFDFLGFHIPVATQARHEQVVRLHLHRRSTDQIAETKVRDL